MGENMKRLLLLIAACCVGSAVAFAQDLDPRVFRQVLRKPGDDGSKSYRIPGLVTTPKGTGLAVFDIRYDGGADLPADIDVGLMRSTDDGAT